MPSASECTLRAKNSNENTGDDALDWGPDNDASDLRPRLRREPGGHPVDGTEDCSQQEAQKNLVHRSSSLSIRVMTQLSC
jgi:hypothetical protein